MKTCILSALHGTWLDTPGLGCLWQPLEPYGKKFRDLSFPKDSCLHLDRSSTTNRSKLEVPLCPIFKKWGTIRFLLSSRVQRTHCHQFLPFWIFWKKPSNCVQSSPNLAEIMVRPSLTKVIRWTWFSLAFIHHQSKSAVKSSHRKWAHISATLCCIETKLTRFPQDVRQFKPF